MGLKTLFSQIGIPLALQIAPQLMGAISSNMSTGPLSPVESALGNGFDPGILEDRFTNIKGLGSNAISDTEALGKLNNLLASYEQPQQAPSKMLGTPDVVGLYNQRKASNYDIAGATPALDSATNMFTIGVPDGMPVSDQNWNEVEQLNSPVARQKLAAKLRSQEPNIITIKDLYKDISRKTSM